MDSSEDKWAEFHEKALPYDQAIRLEPFKTLIETIINFVKQHKIDILLETGFGTGYLMLRLAESISDIDILGVDNSLKCQIRFEELVKEQHPALIEPENRLFGTVNQSITSDIFDENLYIQFASTIQKATIYHQGLLEHFSNDKIQRLLNLQVEFSDAVIFSIPSFFYGRQDFGDERLLTIEQWQEILIPFDLIELKYYDDKKHILGILKGGFYDGRAEGA